MNKIFLSVVIPCFDEMANLQKGVLDKVVHFLEKKEYSFELVIVDDGSKDGSFEFIERFAKENTGVTIVKGEHKGKGAAVTTGVLASSGKYVLFTDMDQATPIEELDTLLPFFDKGYDIVIGSRNATRKGSPWTRIIMARGMMMIRSFIIGLKNITDTQCGFKMFKASVAHALFKKMKEYHKGFGKVNGSKVAAGFDVELLFIAQKLNYKIKEVPIHWLYVETRRVNPVKDSIDAVKDLFFIKVHDLQGKYASQTK